MTTAVYIGRRWFRRQWRSYLASSLTIALCFGLAFFAFAGARRTQSSYPRFLRDVNTSTVSVTTSGDYDDDVNAQIASLPQVVSSRTYIGLLIVVYEDGVPDMSPPFEGEGTLDGRFYDQDRFTPTAGRMADPAREDEVVVNEVTAQRLGYHVGQSVDVGIFSLEQVQASMAGTPQEPVVRTEVTVVGVGLFPGEVVQDDADRAPQMLATPALTRRATSAWNYGVQGLVLRQGDDDVRPFLRDLATVVPLGDLEVNITSVDAATALRAIEPLSLVIAVFGALAAAAGLLLSCQALGRSVRAGRNDRRALVVFGAVQREVWGTSMMLPIFSVVVGLAGAVAIAIAASPAMPLGPVRRVEADPGLDADWFVLIVGSAAVFVCLMAWTTAVVWREVRARRVATRAAPIRSPRFASAPGLPASAGVGLRFALSVERGAPVARSAMLSSVTAAAAVVAALVFTASLSDLVNSPAAYGWNFDAALIGGNGYDNIDPGRSAEILDADEAVDAWSGVYFGADTSGDVDVPMIGMLPTSDVRPPMLSGRFIGDEDEVVLGRSTASELGVDVGDPVVFDGDGTPRELTVVGIAVLPTIGKTHSQRTSLGRGAVVVPDVVPGSHLDILGVPHDELPGPNAIFVRYRPGVDHEAELLDLRRTTAVLEGFAGFDVLGVQRPAEIVVADDVGAAPMVLALGLAVGATVSLVVALGASVRRHRAALAVLTALGFTGRQRAAAIMWQSTAVMAIGVVVGIPMGTIIGRQLWQAFATRVHVDAAPVATWLACALVAGAALVIANALALGPARSATRIDVSGALRTDRQ